MSEDNDDPFEELGPAEEREGDPFERLDADPPEGRHTDAETADEHGVRDPTDAEAGRPPTDGWQGTPDAESGAATDDKDPGDDIFSAVDTEEFRSEPAADPDDPFSGMDDRGEDPFGGGESVFERVDVEQVDADKVWAEIAEDDDGGDTSETRYAEVSKHRYCEQCEHFSAPPNARCTNEGTEIMEFLDMETVRLLDCPIVAEQHEIEDEQ